MTGTRVFARFSPGGLAASPDEPDSAEAQETGLAAGRPERPADQARRLGPGEMREAGVGRGTVEEKGNDGAEGAGGTGGPPPGRGFRRAPGGRWPGTRG